MDIIRKYRPGDAAQLVTAYNQMRRHYAPATRPLTVAQLHQQLEDAVGGDGRIWVTELAGNPIAYVLLAPIPGLSNLAHLEGFVAPDAQHRGIGGRLLEHVQHEARERGWQLSCPVEALDSLCARFLYKHGFQLEHEEIILRRPLDSPLPEITATPPGEIVILPRRQAIARFCALYEQVFTGLPWAQPYSQAEVTTLLHATEDLLFYRAGNQLCGFAWLQINNRQLEERLAEREVGTVGTVGTVGIIEPVGIIPAYRGQGYGRFLLSAALHELQRRGVPQAQIGTWTINEVAIRLYKSLGFEYHHSVYYLTSNSA